MKSEGKRYVRLWVWVVTAFLIGVAGIILPSAVFVYEVPLRI